MNKKKIWLLSLISSIFAFFSINIVNAAPDIGDTLNQVFGWLVIDLSQITTIGSEASFYARMILFFVIFAVLYFAASKIFGEDKRRTSGAIAFALAVMGAVAVPAPYLKAIFESYALFFAIVMIALPIVAVFWLTHQLKTKVWPEHPLAHKLLSAFAYWFLLTLFNGLNIAAKGSEIKALAEYDNWIAFGSGIVTLLLIWNIAALLLGLFGKGAEKTGVSEAVKKKGFVPAFKSKAKNLKKSILGETKLEVAEFKFLKNIKELLEKAKGKGKIFEYKDEILKEIEKIEEINKRTEQLTAYEIKLEGIVEKIGSPEAKNLLKKVKEISKVMYKLFEEIEHELEEVKKQVVDNNAGAARTTLNPILKTEKRIIDLSKQLLRIAEKIEDLE